MQFLGIGPLEFLLIVVLAVIILGPKGMVGAAREAGKLVRKVARSPLWREVVDTSRELRDLPQQIVREAGIEAELEEFRRKTQAGMADIQHELQASIPDAAAIQPNKHESKADDINSREEENESAGG